MNATFVSGLQRLPVAETRSSIGWALACRSSPVICW